MTVSIDIIVPSARWKKSFPASPASFVKRAVKTTLEHLKLSRHNVSIAVSLTNDAEIRKLNHQFRGKDKPTNVLSFPGDENHFGDIALAYETLAREAKEQNKSFRDHVTHMLVHGTLHLAGFDHLKTKEAEKMETVETQILKKLGIADPYML